ncbi:hypothetical protein B566_EDAN009440 [Ephemera danica]|nr:hypothetical protein B566_EDAN009440 [Ephemera danica]
MDDILQKDHRPPLYNPEDYACSLKKWSRRSGPLLYSVPGAPGTEQTPGQQTPGAGNTNTAPPRYNWRRGASEAEPAAQTPPSQGRDYRNPNLTSSSQGEMSLRQFASVSELLTKLRQDLRLALPSFVQEFVGEPLDGVTLLLEVLRAVQLSQASHKTRAPPALARRALLDEHECLQCLQSCVARSQEGARRLATSPAGLFTVAVGIMSNVTKSRVLALQLLTKACEPPVSGHSAVSEAMSTLRLRFGEPVRFRFLVGMLSSGAGASSPELQSIGLRFVNTFLEASPGPQVRLYIQAELEQAGFMVSTIKKSLPANVAAAEEVRAELARWEHGYIDVQVLKARAEAAERELGALRDKNALLDRKIQILQEEKGVLLSLERCLKDRCGELEDELRTQHPLITSVKGSSCKMGSTPEDEGISSSDQPSSGEENGGTPAMSRRRAPTEEREVCEVLVEAAPLRETSVDQQDSEDEEETTIEEVIEELRNIINDAESEVRAQDQARQQLQQQQQLEEQEAVRTRIRRPRQRAPDLHFEDRASPDRPLTEEIEIVPTRLPQPPRRSRALALLRDGASGVLFFDEETPSDTSDSDSLLSASRDPHSTEQPPRNSYVYGGHSNGMRSMPTTQTSVIPVRRSESFQQRNLFNAQPIQQEHLNRFYITHQDPIPSKLKSKSLERIDEGLNTMVDIVTHVRWEPQQPSPNHDYRSTGFPRYSDQRYPPDGASSAMSGSALFLSQIEPSPPNNHYKAPFITRGHVNAGLYSGQAKPITVQCPGSVSRTASVPSSAGRLTDLPSGLY